MELARRIDAAAASRQANVHQHDVRSERIGALNGLVVDTAIAHTS